MAPRRSARQAAAAAAAQAQAPAPAAASTANKKKKTSAPRKRSATHGNAKPKRPPTKKIKHTGLTQTVPATDEPLGVIDPESGITGKIVTLDDEPDQPLDVMLVLVDPAKNMDKFFVLQVIEKTGGGYCVYTRWGRTGTVGQALQQDYPDLDGAKDCFEKKFKQKTGNAWEDRLEPTQGNKYRYIEQDYEGKQNGFADVVWQYWVDDGIDGKEDGWYDYDTAGSAQAERLFSEHSKNTGMTNRYVSSGAWTYDLDMINMTQTNATHPNHTVRRIRRCPKDEEMSDAPPSAVPATTPAASTPARKKKPTNSAKTPASTPARKKVPTNSAKTPVVTPNRPAAAAAASAASSSSSPPVDPDVLLWGRNASDFEVVAFGDNPDRYYDAVLNQCNIKGGNNNNKYYRIQMLHDSSADKYFVWQKWGRVGEPGRKTASALKGPFANESKALPEYSKKFRAKTGNDYDTDNFESYEGKYTLIEIDNNVKVEDGNSNAAALSNNKNVKYEDSKLDAKTRELVEVLFSKDMRDEALTNFNLDLKRLPLGVPSQQQIQQGLAILQQIEDKLGGQRVKDSYEDLSSQFYTAIPHSFGRSRPPPINNGDKLQSRFDMCNILLDMYSTNETLLRLQEEESNKEEEILPNPIDRHYGTLHTDLSLLDKKSDDYKKIVDYFTKTKSEHSNSKLLDVWEVNRHTEGQRFAKFDKVDNRRLLWHGTNIAVVAPILTSGLRIMPHSGGRVGAGIYLAALQEKSAQYTSGYGAKFACMFLCEAALGKMHPVTEDGSHASSLKKAPQGFDSVRAVGRTGPEEWGEMEIEGKTVSIPTDKPKTQDDGKDSSFYHDEFLCYEESQVRLRYIITLHQ